MTTATPSTTTLTGCGPGDRCDRCGAAAQVVARLATGGELLFCRHHARAHAPRLRESGAALIPDP
ncbi:MAG TPA: hypothetical protein VD813_09935 [Pseudonocardia sp.]|nr:hypothetical protein [Pseudonocardia sp.]